MGKVIDLTGQRFGRLTVIKQLEKDKWNRAHWLCQCDCGNQIDAAGVNLRKGSTKSCGCLQRELSSQRNTKDLTGQRFGKLTVIKDSGKRGASGEVYWKCQCDCGNTTLVRSNHLLEKNPTQSCGQCNNLIDITGNKYGKLTVISYDFEKKKWKCQCDCGNITYVDTNNLKSGNTSSCGCIKSKGEDKISKILQENHINFEIHKTFDSCRIPDTNILASFDFYLPDYNILIEYDGEQHFIIRGWNTQEQLERIQFRDEYKNQWCQQNNIKLIRIPYTDYDNLNIEYLYKQFESLSID